MIKCDIAIVDSGVDLSIAPLAQGVCLEKNNYGYTFNPKLSDEVGHGTIMYSIIKNQAESANIYVIKLPTQSEDESSIIEALKFIRANISCKLVNISLGVKTGDNLNELYTHCKEITESGTIIVSAFDNEGCHSFPAAFDCVIGVDSKNNLGGKTIFEYVENSPINILAMGSIQKIKMPNNKVLLCGGSSVAGAYITSFLYNNLSTWNSLNDVLDFLKEKSRCVFRSHHHPSTSNKILFNIENAAVFPFSKETQAFLRFSDHLSFHIDDYYDVRNSGKVGRKLRDYCELTESKKTIKDIDKIDFRNIDTIIMGHLEELNALLKRDFRKELLAKAIENNVNVYSFDSLNYTNLLSNTRKILLRIVTTMS